MKLLLLSAFGMTVAMSVAEPKSPESGLEAQLMRLEELVGQRMASLNKLVSDPVSADEGAVAGAHAVKSNGPAIGLHTGTLRPGLLQPASGLQSRARGLTAEAEWRRMFPHKPGYSR